MVGHVCIARWVRRVPWIALILAACGQDPADVAVGRLTVGITGLPAGVAADVAVLGPAGFEQALEATTTLSSLQPGTYQVTAQEVAAGGETYAPVVTGAPAAVAAGAATEVGVAYGPGQQLDPLRPIVESVAIQGYGTSLQARQNVRLIVVEVEGSNLDGMTSADLGPLPGIVQANDATRAEIAFDVRLETPFGPHDMVVVTDRGTAIVANAVVVTPATVGPEGDDATGRGTPDSPFRTLTFAVTRVDPHSTIVLFDGIYTSGTGETWPILLQDLTVIGQSRSGTVLVPAPGPPSAVDGLELRGRSTIASLTVTNFRIGLRAASGALVVDDVRVVFNDLHGLMTLASGGDLESIEVRESILGDNGESGIHLESGVVDVDVTVRASELARNGGHGIFVGGGATAVVTDSSLDDNQFRGAAVGGASSLTLERTSVVNSNVDGLIATGASDLRLDDVLVRGSLRHGIDRRGTGTLWMRDSQILNNVVDGIRITNTPVVDLGDEARSGRNQFGKSPALPAAGALIGDDRPAGSEPPIRAHGSRFEGLEPDPTGLRSGPMASHAPYWRIANLGNTIDFGP